MQRRRLLLLLGLALLAGSVGAGIAYWRTKAGYDAYRALIQPGIRIAGIPVGWRTAEEAQDQIATTVAQPYYRDILLHYEDETIPLSPRLDVDLDIPVGDMVEEALAASHEYDYWQGYWAWLRGDAVLSDLDVPLRMSIDESAVANFLQDVATAHDILPVEATIDVDTLTFLPGSTGRRLELEEAARLIRDTVTQPARRDITLPVSVLEPEWPLDQVAAMVEAAAEVYDRAPVEPMVDVAALAYLPGVAGRYLDVQEAVRLISEAASRQERREISLPIVMVEPDQSRARIESMLRTLAPIMEKEPVPPSIYTATIPLSTTGGLSNTPLVSYTGELTWTFPHFVSYTGHLTSTYGYFVQPGEGGSRFNVEHAINQVEAAILSGKSSPIRFEPEVIPPPPITPDVLIPPLEARLARFPGVSCLLVKNLETGETVYDRNVDYVLSGMSVVKIGILFEVYRHYGGVVDAQTEQELRDMLGSESCNPCANRLLAAVGGGSSQVGAQKVTNTMHLIGLSNFRLCGPFRVVEGPAVGGQVLWVSNLGGWSFLAQAQVPRYDSCVRATPREMATLLEMIYQGKHDTGLLREMFPDIEAGAYETMIDIMAANDLRNMLGAGIPAEAKLAHKHGFAGYDVPWGDTRAEVGIVFSPGAAWLVSFYIWEDSPWIDYGVMQPLYRDVSNLLYNYFNPQAQYWPLPPWTPPLDDV